MKNNILKYDYCYGCGVCVDGCPKRIIEIRLNRNGFYEPWINDVDACVECGICLEICSFGHDGIAQHQKPLKHWAAWSDEERVRQKCSSGGIGFEIGKQLIGQGYKAVVCRYNVEEQRAEHYIATTVEELIPSIGSKYIQSYTTDGFIQINRKEKYLVTGTPCQIDSFRRYIQKYKCEDNFVLMDFFCHGVPSKLMWDRYVKWAEKKVGKLTYVSWRNKRTGWHDSWAMGIDGEEHGEKVDWHDSYNVLIKEKKCFLNSRWSQGDLFYKLFLGDFCTNPACSKNCKFKYDHSSADIRIGDLWGTAYREDQKGVSALVAFTEKGCGVLESLKDVTLIEHPFEVVAEGQMKENSKSKETAPFIFYLLRHGYSLTCGAIISTMFIQRIISKVKRIAKI